LLLSCFLDFIFYLLSICYFIFHSINQNKQEDTKALATILSSTKTNPLDFDQLDGDGEAALHKAVRTGKLAIVDLLLGYYKKTNKDINVVDR
jgi:hypothetical protein